MRFFIVIGFTRSGTTSLYDSLKDLKNGTSVTKRKQMNYLLGKGEIRLDEYLEQFIDNNAKFLFDISPDYESDLDLVKSNLARLNIDYVPLVMLRDPEDRFVSWIRHIGTIYSKQLIHVNLKDYSDYLEKSFDYDGFVREYFKLSEVATIRLDSYVKDVAALLGVNEEIIPVHNSNRGGTVRSINLNRLIRFLRVLFRFFYGNGMLPGPLRRVSDWQRRVNSSDAGDELIRIRYEKEINYDYKGSELYNKCRH